MKLLTKAIQARFKEVGRQELEADPIVICKFFHPMSNWTAYATEYDEQKGLFFGLVFGFEEEWGYFSLNHMESIVVGGVPIERDLYFVETRISKISKVGR